MKYCLLFCLLMLALSTDIYAQYEEGDRWFEQGVYTEALKSYLSAQKQQKNDPQLLLRIGRTYLLQRDANQQQEALSYLQKAYESGTQNSEVAYYYAEALMRHEQFEAAATIAEQASSKTQDARLRKQLELRKQGALLALQSYQQPQEVYIENAGKPINSKDSELMPVMSTDDGRLLYTRKKYQAKSRQTEESIWMAIKEQYLWTQSQPLRLPGIMGNAATVSLSPDGQYLFLYMYDPQRRGELYVSQFDGNSFTQPQALPEPINSAYEESGLSISADGSWLIFASDRPEGYGGKDLYICYKQADGSWGNVQNLGPDINTPFDEDAPFLHPDGRTLYFSSNGHPGLGGMDIFRAEHSGNTWARVQNMGYPINSPFNDSYYCLSADGKRAYFSSDRPGGIGETDLYLVGIPDESNQTIPLTMIRGLILAGDPPAPVPTRIRVIDKEKNEYLPFVYNPNPNTGYYLMVFPPGKNYDMIIEAEGYMPYLVNIHIPNQRYFYELHQEIRLSKKILDDKAVAEQISITNLFEPIPAEKQNPAQFGEQKLDLYQLMEDIIATADSTALNYLLEIMYKDAPLLEPMQGMKNIKPAIEVTFFYEDPQGKLQEIRVGEETIKTLPRIHTDKNSVEEDYSGNQGPISLNKKYVAYFPSGKAELTNRARAELLKFIDYARRHPEAGIVVYGFTSPEGETEKNQLLSEERAKAVYDFFVDFGIESQRIRYKGMGSHTTEDVERRLMRRIDLILVPLNELNAY